MSESRRSDLDDLRRAIRAFGEERDWTGFHTPKNLVMALTGEVGELNEIFQWLSEDEAASVMSTDEAEHVREELADVMIYLIRLADVLGVDFERAVRTKMARNAVRYPAPGAAG